MENDIRIREEILSLLKNQFQKDCPDCHLNAFGSFYNGFGFRNSDLDVCFIFKDGREQKVRLPSDRISVNRRQTFEIRLVLSHNSYIERFKCHS